jgi:hypothetical protein
VSLQARAAAEVKKTKGKCGELPGKMVPTWKTQDRKALAWDFFSNFWVF